MDSEKCSMMRRLFFVVLIGFIMCFWFSIFLLVRNFCIWFYFDELKGCLYEFISILWKVYFNLDCL